MKSASSRELKSERTLKINDLKHIPVVNQENGHLFVTSENVAQVFQKEHKNVLRDIENILAENDESRAPNFGLTFEIRHIGNTKRRTKVVHLTRDGLMFLVMGYTGKKANALKWAYIDEFNRMEKELRGEVRKTITPEQQLAIREAVNVCAYRSGHTHQYVYRELFYKFDIPRYTELLEEDFPAAMAFLGAGKQVRLPKPKESDKVEISRDLLRHIAGFTYEMRYLYRPMMENFYKFLNASESPMAGRYYDLITCLKFENIQRHLKFNGMDLEELYGEHIKSVMARREQLALSR